MKAPLPQTPERSSRGERSSSASRLSPVYAPARPELQEAVRILAQRKWSILSIAALLVGIGTFFSYQQTPIYESDAAVLVLPLEPGIVGSVPQSELNIATEVEVAGSFAVAEVVAESLEADTDPENLNPGNLLNGLSVGSPSDTEIISFSYRHPSPQQAQQRAQNFARGYLEYRRQMINEQLAGSAAALEEEIRTLSQRLDRVERQLDQLDEDDPDWPPLESEGQLLRGLILDRQLDRIALREDAVVGRVVQPAGLPSDPASPNHALNAGFALAVGLALGIGLAFLRDRLSGRLRSDEEVELASGAPILGRIPRVPAWRRRKQAYLVTRSEWGSPSAESYRMLRTNLLSTASLYGVKTLLITSAHIGEGKTATAANLGLALAKAGKRVTLVSADLRRPRLHEFFPIRPKVGLSEVLSGGASLSEAIVRGQPSPGNQGLENLSFLLTGAAKSQDASELLSSERMLQILHQLEEESDLVLLDAPPALPVTDAMILARLVDGVLYVVGPRSLTQHSVSTARQQLDKVGANVLGVVLNGTGLGVSGSYYTY